MSERKAIEIFDEAVQANILHELIDGRYYQDGIPVEDWQIEQAIKAGHKFPFPELNKKVEEPTREDPPVRKPRRQMSDEAIAKGRANLARAREIKRLKQEGRLYDPERPTDGDS